MSQEVKNEIPEPELWPNLYGDKLYSFAYKKLGQRELAEDLVQECIMKAFECTHQFNGKAKFSTWLIAILKNLIFDYNRKSYKISAIQIDSLDPEESDFFLADGHWKHELLGDELNNRLITKNLKSCMCALDEKYRSVFL